MGVEDRVVSFLKERVEDGSADAAFDLAKRYEEGKGVTADPVEAHRLYKLSAERGNEEATTWLAEHPEPEGAAKAAADGQPAGEKPEAAGDEAAATPAAKADPAAPSEDAALAVPAETQPKP
ncbi:MAG: SEL1-like repeat protein [Verrucomicrobia bacterium]|nr:SEL1-like repeat protein [Verrucomicrobiota bacterium]